MSSGSSNLCSTRVELGSLAAGRPFIASIVAVGVAWVVRSAYLYSMPLLARLVIETAIVVVTMAVIVFSGAEEKLMYTDLFRQLTKSPSNDEGPRVSPV